MACTSLRALVMRASGRSSRTAFSSRSQPESASSSAVATRIPPAILTRPPFAPEKIRRRRCFVPESYAASTAPAKRRARVAGGIHSHSKESAMSIKRHGVGPRLSQAVVHGNTVYLAGIIAGDPSADAKGQTEQILKKIDEHLAAVGSHKSELLSATIYVSNMGLYNDMNAAWDAWIDKANTPARATVEARLATPKFLVEIMAVAAI